MSNGNEAKAMERVRETIVNEEVFKRYIRVGSERLSLHLAKLTLTSCYGIPVKGEPGQIRDDEDVGQEASAAAVNDDTQDYVDCVPPRSRVCPLRWASRCRACGMGGASLWARRRWPLEYGSSTTCRKPGTT